METGILSWIEMEMAYQFYVVKFLSPTPAGFLCERKSNEQERKLHDLQAVSMRPRSGAHQSVRADEQRLRHLVLSGHPGVISGLHSKVRLHPALPASIIIQT